MTTQSELHVDGTNGNGATGNGDGPALINTAEISGRDLQRHALRELVELSEQCAADETDIERRHDEGLAAERQDVEHKTFASEKRAKAVEEEIRAKYQERLNKIQAQFNAETASIREATLRGSESCWTRCQTFTPRSEPCWPSLAANRALRASGSFAIKIGCCSGKTSGRRANITFTFACLKPQMSTSITTASAMLSGRCTD